MTTCWSSRSGCGLCSAVWRPTVAVYLGACLAALAAGLCPEAIRPHDHAHTLTPSPALQTLAVVQVVFVMLIYPLILWRRRGSDPRRGYWSRAAVEGVGFMAAAVPMYVVAGYFSDATVGDVVRTAIAVALVLPAAWTAGVLLERGLLRPVVVVVLLAAVVGGPAMVYIQREFLPELTIDCSAASPVVLIWRTAAARQGELVPGPLWAAFLWPGVAAAGWFAQMLVPGRAESSCED